MRAARTTPIMATACATVCCDRCSILSQWLAISGAASDTSSTTATATPPYKISRLRSRSRIDCALCAPAEKRAISRFSVGVSPISSNASHACNMVMKPTNPHASIPR